MPRDADVAIRSPNGEHGPLRLLIPAHRIPDLCRVLIVYEDERAALGKAIDRGANDGADVAPSNRADVEKI